jgi:hypothetical protein
MAATESQSNEERIAQRAQVRDLAEVMARRSRYLMVAVLATIGGVLWILTASAANGLLLVLIGAIFAVLYLDANGLVHEVRQRPTRRLATDLSVLEEQGNGVASQLAPRSANR